MPRLKLDFRIPVRVSLLTWAVIVAATAGVSRELMLRADRLIAIEATQARIDRLERLQAKGLARASSVPMEAAVEDEARALAQALAAPWEPMLDDLQRAAAGEVLLTQLQPGADGVVTISGRAPTSAAFLAYLARLRQRPGWREVAPLSEVRGEPDLTGNPVVFQMVAEYAGKN